jgi:predicted DCC family thiol-disulfide oxidoreductase YuxK
MSMAAIHDQAAEAPALVLYDGLCRLCQKSVAVLKRLDWCKQLAFQDARDEERLPAMTPPLVPERLMEEMHVVTPDRRRAYPGFEAFRWMAWRLPLLLPFAPFLYLPGVPAIGTAVYRWVARNRFKLVPCHDGQCELPPPSKR